MQTTTILFVQPIKGRNSSDHTTKQIPNDRNSGAGYARRNEVGDGIGQAELLPWVCRGCAQ